MSFIYDMIDTWNNGATTFTAVKMNVTDTASAAGSLLMDLQVGGVSKFSMSKDGILKTNVFNAVPQTSPTYARGNFWYDSTTEALSVHDDVSGTSIQLGHELIMRCRNNTGTQINDGQVVYISGAVGQNPTIALARADSVSTSRVIGVATHNIANNATGKITVYGLVNDIDTSAFADGDVVYLSPTTAGALTNVAPTGPTNTLAKVGIISSAHPVNGKLMVITDLLLYADILRVLGGTEAAARTTLGAEGSANKDTSGGYAGLTLLKLNMKNVLGTVTSFLTNTNTAARTYTLPDKDLTVAGLIDFATPPAIGNTTPAAGNFTDLTIDADVARPFRLKKSTAAVTAPAAGYGLLRWEVGTNAGTLKLVGYSGTSTTGVTIIDNVGTGN